MYSINAINPKPWHIVSVLVTLHVSFEFGQYLRTFFLKIALHWCFWNLGETTSCVWTKYIIHSM